MSTLDRAVNNDVLMISKSLLPYLKPDRQKPIAVLIKAMELMYTINLYSSEDFVRSMSRSQETGWEKNFLTDVKQNLSSDKAYFIDAILKITEARDLLSPRSTDEPSYSLHASDSGIPEDKPLAPPITPSATSAETPSSSPNPSQIIDKLSPLLDPSQVQLLKLLSGFMK